MRIEATEIIEKPVTEVFRFQSEEHLVNHPRWDPAVSSLEPLTDGPVRLGAKFRLIRNVMGRTRTNIFEVTEWDPPVRMTITSSEPGFQLQISSRCEPAGENSTRLTVTGESRLSGLRVVLALLARPRLEAEAHANVRRIKTMLEAI